MIWHVLPAAKSKSPARSGAFGTLGARIQARLPSTFRLGQTRVYVNTTKKFKNTQFVISDTRQKFSFSYVSNPGLSITSSL